MDYKKYWFMIKKRNGKYKLNYMGFIFDIESERGETKDDIRNKFLDKLPEEKLIPLFHNEFFIDALQQLPENLFIAIKNCFSFNTYKMSFFNDSKTHYSKTGTFLLKKSKEDIYKHGNRSAIKSIKES